MKMKIKVCGLGDANQISELDQSKRIDFVGFIFYKKSSRFLNSDAKKTKYVRRVGVFVDEDLEELILKISDNDLDVIQLHGNETIEYMEELNSKIQNSSFSHVKIWKAIGIEEVTDFKAISKYENWIEYFVFDTKSNQFGGSGRTYDWTILNKYQGNKHFFLSGGISSQMIKEIKQFNHSKCIGLDLNSGFEISPMNKDIEEIIRFTKEINEQ